MKVVSSLRPICKDCYIVRRGKRLYMRCKTFPRHKRRQGFSSLAAQSHGLYDSSIQNMSPLTQFWMTNQTNAMLYSQ